MTKFSLSKEACPPVLAGLRVLDFSVLLPGPFATVILGDLGADIIKVEGPQGDPARTTPGAAKFPGVNRNKRSIAVDLKKAEARPIVDALIDWCDVLVEGFRPRVTTRLGIDYDIVFQRKPKIIYCSISGYGQTGPWQDLPGHDPNYLATAGALAFSGHWLDRPRRSSLPFSDLIGGALAVVSILCTLRQLEKSGKGAWLDLSLFEATMFCTAARFGLDAEHAHRDLLRPTNDLFETADGKSIALGVNEPHIWREFRAAVVALMPALKDPRFDDEEGRRQHGDDLARMLQELFRQKQRDAWISYLRPKGIPIQACLTPAEAARTEQVIARDLIAQLDGYRCVPFPTKMNGEPFGRLRTREPRRGQHTREVLAGLGFDAVTIDGFAREGVAICDPDASNPLR